MKTRRRLVKFALFLKGEPEIGVCSRVVRCDRDCFAVTGDRFVNAFELLLGDAHVGVRLGVAWILS